MQIKITTKGGLVLLANAANVATDGDSLVGVWDMRHNLIRNPSYFKLVRSSEIKEVSYGAQ